ncbi:NlpC/P60 family protein [Caulobacter sp. NIBR2454]|uniref:NlpC/P60 family protein n=1 Tax=Caulobacter sp. NIBR2454 TaxID=3015996 RepID=UPI0022B670A9|nr:NlpC/P60 family protein [Caulobacter sp. NIBR2454]
MSVITSATSWIGTPYQHQASVKGAGADCLGMVRGVWREVVGAEPERPPPYRPDWAEIGGGELLVEALGRWMSPVALDKAKAGDVLVFRMAPEAAAKHCAILIADPGGGREGRMVHAYWGRAVVESWLGRWWRSRLAAAFCFPGAE